MFVSNRPPGSDGVFAWSDAWVFAALRGASDDAGDVDFSKLIAVADMLNHAIVTAEEVRQALTRLHGSGLVEVIGSRVTSTSLATTLHEKIAGARGGLFSIVENALRVLNSPRTGLPVVPGAPDTAFVTDDFMKEAYDRYLGRFRGGTGMKPLAPVSEETARLAAAAEERERAILLATTDTPGALRAAREVCDPWYRVQALAWVARFAPEAEFESIAIEALDVRRQCADWYQRVAAAAWPLRALVERGALVTARAGLAPLLDEEARVQVPVSRSEALFLLFQACFDLDAGSRDVLVRRLAAAHDVAGHWRSRRNIVDALSMLGGWEPRLVREVAESLADERVRRRIDGPRSQADRTPRPFF